MAHRGDAWSFPVRPISITRTAANRVDHDDRADHNCLDLHRKAQTLRGRTPRSRSDRTAIAARSSRDRASFVVELPPRSSYGGRWSINTMIDARSWPDRGAIVVLLEAKLKPNSPSNWSGIEATTSPQGTAPMTPLISPHDRLYRP